jgi:hypothetical protein
MRAKVMASATSRKKSPLGMGAESLDTTGGIAGVTTVAPAVGGTQLAFRRHSLFIRGF